MQTGPDAGRGPRPAVIVALAAVGGFVAWMALILVHGSMDGIASSSEPLSYRAGMMTVIAGGSAVLVGVLARYASSGRGWPRWTISPAVVVVAGLWFTMTEVVPAVGDRVEARVSGETDGSLTAPASAGDWTLLEGRAAERREQQAKDFAQDAQSEGYFSDIVVGSYTGRSGSFLGFVGFHPAEGLRAEIADSAEQAVRDMLAGAGGRNVQVLPAGDLGGAIGCTEEADPLPPGAFMCVWTDASTVGQVTILQPDLDVEKAGEVTREFRGHVTQPVPWP